MEQVAPPTVVNLVVLVVVLVQEEHSTQYKEVLVVPHPIQVKEMQVDPGWVQFHGQI
tara:strand:- start:118 stop:288 length:171 start_codon:yes stop_codon:yes gene_type:complete